MEMETPLIIKLFLTALTMYLVFGILFFRPYSDSREKTEGKKRTDADNMEE